MPSIWCSAHLPNLYHPVASTPETELDGRPSFLDSWAVAMIHREALGGNLYRRTIEDRTFHFLKHIAEMSSSPELPKMKACMAASGWTRLYLEVWQSWPSTILVKVLNSDPTKSLCRHVVGTTGQHILFEPEDYCSWRTGHQTIWSICQTQCICRIKCSRLGKYEGFSIPCSWDILRLKHTKKNIRKNMKTTSTTLQPTIECSQT